MMHEYRREILCPGYKTIFLITMYKKLEVGNKTISIELFNTTSIKSCKNKSLLLNLYVALQVNVESPDQDGLFPL